MVEGFLVKDYEDDEETSSIDDEDTSNVASNMVEDEEISSSLVVEEDDDNSSDNEDATADEIAKWKVWKMENKDKTEYVVDGIVMTPRAYWNFHIRE